MTNGISDHTSTIRNVQFDFTLQFRGPSGEDGREQRFTRRARGEGWFHFDGNSEKIIIEKLKLKVDLDLFA